LKRESRVSEQLSSGQRLELLGGEPLDRTAFGLNEAPRSSRILIKVHRKLGTLECLRHRENRIQRRARGAWQVPISRKFHSRLGNFRFTSLKRRSLPASGPGLLASPQSQRNSHGDSSEARKPWIHYFIARIQPLPLARFLVDPHLKVIPLETSARLSYLRFTF